MFAHPKTAKRQFLNLLSTLQLGCMLDSITTAVLSNWMIFILFISKTYEKPFSNCFKAELGRAQFLGDTYRNETSLFYCEVHNRSTTY